MPLLSTYFAAAEIAIYFVYDGNELIGVVPFVEGGAGSSGCRPRWSSPVNAHVRRIGILANAMPEMVLDAVFTAVTASPHLRDRKCVGMLQLPEGDWLDIAVQRAARMRGLSRNTTTETRSAVVDVPNGWDSYVVSRTSEQLHPLRKRRKLQAKGAGTWEFSTLTDAGHVEHAWERLLHVEARSWKHRSGTSILNDPGAMVFYGNIARTQAARGRLRIDLLQKDGEAVAHCFGVVHGKVYYLLKHSFDEQHRALSPGFQLLWFTMQQRVTEGCTRLDLLGDEMSWKRAVATHLPQYVSHQLFPPTHVGCQWCRLSTQVLKPTVRKLGLKRLVQAMRPDSSE